MRKRLCKFNEWCRRDERLGESVMGLTGVQMAWFDCSLRAKVSEPELGVGTTGAHHACR